MESTLITGSMEEKHKKVLGKMEVDMDGRFSQVRTQETNLGKVTACYFKNPYFELCIYMEIIK